MELTGLSDDVVEIILSYLDLPDLKSTFVTCKYLRSFAASINTIYSSSLTIPKIFFQMSTLHVSYHGSVEKFPFLPSTCTTLNLICHGKNVKHNFKDANTLTTLNLGYRQIKSDRYIEFPPNLINLTIKGIDGNSMWINGKRLPRSLRFLNADHVVNSASLPKLSTLIASVDDLDRLPSTLTIFSGSGIGYNPIFPASLTYLDLDASKIDSYDLTHCRLRYSNINRKP